MSISMKFNEKTGLVEYGAKNSDIDFNSVTGKYKGFFSGSLTRLQNGDPYIIAGDNVSILTTSLGQIVINSLGGSGSGSVGPQGPSGSMGPQGPKGDQGDKGDIGLQGPTGSIGLTGPQGIQGLKGDKGDTGLTGLQGPSGSIGLTGSQGIQGIQGISGSIGPRGLTGLQGPPGTNGTNGIDGINGTNGQDAPIRIYGSANVNIASDEEYAFSNCGDYTINIGNIADNMNGTIAEKDLELRGPGEVYGVRQSGVPDFHFADLRDVALISEIRSDIEEWIKIQK